MAGMFGAVKSRPVDGTAIGRALFGTPKRSLAPITAADRFKGVPRGTYSGPSLKAAKPSLGERMKQRTSDALASIGVSRRTANRVADRVTGFLEDVTPAGDAMTADDARTAFRQGKPAKGLGLGALAALGVVPGFGDAISKAAKGIRAWHGSPHDFDRFDLSKIGTGEGAQAYGHGLYFAENPTVARGYQETLAGYSLNGRPLVDSERQANLLLQKHGGDYAKAIDDAEWKLDRLGRGPIEHLTQWQDVGMAPQPAGHLYEVDIAAKPDDLLDWDAPLWSQPQAVQRLMRERGEMREMPRLDISETAGGKFTLRNVWGEPAGTFKTREAAEAKAGQIAEGHGAYGGQLAYQMLGGNPIYSHLDTGEASKALREAGVPGLRYFDQGSRGSGQGTRNYVIFDDSLVDIVGKY